MDQWTGALLLTLAVFVGIFLLLREVFCWYWKINERISLQRETNRLLQAIADSEVAAGALAYPHDGDEGLDRSPGVGEAVTATGSDALPAVTDVVSVTAAGLPSRLRRRYQEWAASPTDSNLVGFIRELNLVVDRGGDGITQSRLESEFPKAVDLEDFRVVVARIEG